MIDWRTCKLRKVAWYLNALVSLHWRCWNDEWVVFDAGSGQTHQMDTLTAVTLMMIEAKPANVSDLVIRVSEELSISSNQEFFDILVGILDRLTVAGLIESTT